MKKQGNDAKRTEDAVAPTRRQIQLVQTTFEYVRPHLGQLSSAFYSRLFEVEPDIRTLFPVDMDDQRAKLEMALGLAVDGLTDFQAIESTLKQLGQRHQAYGIEPKHYDLVGGVLLYALAQIAGRERMTAEAELAWAAAYGVIARAMLGREGEDSRVG